MRERGRDREIERERETDRQTEREDDGLRNNCSFKNTTNTHSK